jgi:hypothetical protein
VVCQTLFIITVIEVTHRDDPSEENCYVSTLTLYDAMCFVSFTNLSADNTKYMNKVGFLQCKDTMIST